MSGKKIEEFYEAVRESIRFGGENIGQPKRDDLFIALRGGYARGEDWAIWVMNERGNVVEFLRVKTPFGFDFKGLTVPQKDNKPREWFVFLPIEEVAKFDEPLAGEYAQIMGMLDAIRDGMAWECPHLRCEAAIPILRRESGAISRCLDCGALWDEGGNLLVGIKG